MSNGVKIGLIVGVAILAAVCIYVYFSPYQTCVRAAAAGYANQDSADAAGATRSAETYCAHSSN